MKYEVTGVWMVCLEVDSDSEEEAKTQFLIDVGGEHQDFDIISIKRKEK